MTDAVDVVVGFVASPAVGGSRTLPLPLLIETLALVQDTIPHLGTAPTALLLHALATPLASSIDCSSDSDEPEADGRGLGDENVAKMTLEKWVTVRVILLLT